MKQYIDNIKTVHLFSALKYNEIEAISRITALKRYPKGYVVFQEGEQGDALYIIVNGKVKVSIYDEDGREYILDIIGKDGFFGELSLIDELPRSADIITTEDSTFLVIKRVEFLKLLVDNPVITLSILKTLSKRLRAADERIRGFAFLSVEGRILKYLIDIGERTGVKVKNYLIIENGPSQIEIASSCGCSRETVSRMIKNLVEKDVLSSGKRRYTIHLPETSF
ncbi:MAG: Crp/Fnr family transcriptional regulator [Proteobacteria bacterium]|nr:Crp/Fnr family transcriptional regulator [Pseudomonadota bacterium]